MTLIGEASRRSKLAKWSGLLIFSTALGFSIQRNLIAQEFMHPFSLFSLQETADYLFDETLRVPPVRRQKMKERYARLGVFSKADVKTTFESLEREARLEKRDRPNPEGKVFISREYF